MKGSIPVSKSTKNSEQKIKALKDEIKRTQQFSLDLIDHIPDPIFVKDENHRWLLLNDAYCRASGYSREELIGRSDYDFYPKEQADIFWEKDEQVFKTRSTNVNEETYTDAAGVEHTILTVKSFFQDNRGEKYLIGLAHDITDRKKAEQEIVQARKQWETTVDAISEWICLLERDKRIIRSSRSVEQFLGLSVKDIIGKNCCMLIHGTEASISECPVDRMLNSGKRETAEYQDLKRNKWIKISADPVFNKKGDIIQIVHIVRDISRRKKLEADLKHAYKIQSLGTLAGGIAHEFNNILHIIVGYTDLAIEDLPDSKAVKSCLLEIRSASMRGKDVVKRILRFISRSSGRQSAIQISEVVHDTLNLLRATVPSTIDIIKAITCESELIYADPNDIQQVLMNICRNSVDAVACGIGTLKISLKPVNLDDKSANQPEDLKPGSYVQLCVEDDGCGISQEIMDRVMDPYFTTKEVDRGLGMGLAEVYGIVKRYGGTVNIESRVGEGTVVTVLFPQVQMK